MADATSTHTRNAHARALTMGAFLRRFDLERPGVPVLPAAFDGLPMAPMTGAATARAISVETSAESDRLR